MFLRIIILVAVFLTSYEFLWSQKYRNQDFFSASMHLGVNTLPRPKNPEVKPASVGFNLHTHFAYKVNYFWGMRADFAFNLFNSTQKPNVKAMQIGLSGYLDLLQFGTEGYVERIGEFSLYAYSGMGIASSWEKRRLSGDTKYISGNDDMIYYNIGLIPRQRIGKLTTINFDLGYNVVFFHDRYFDGSGALPKKRPGGFFAMNVGVTYEFK